MVLPNDVNEIQSSSNAGYTATFRNGPIDDEGHATKLVAIIVGNATSIDTAKDELRQHLAEQLDLLTFATHSRFQIIAPLRLIEWERDQEKYQFRVFHTIDARYPPEPELVQDYMNTIQTLDHTTLPDFTRKALKYFRYGLLDTQQEDQFMRLWLSLEIIAENMKEKERVQITCPECNSPLRCNTCGTEPTRIPMAKQAIENLIRRVGGPKADAAIKRQFITRNGLMHGGSPESIEEKCRVSLAEIVDELGGITWRAIMSTIRFKEEPSLALGHRGGEFVNKSLVTSILGSFDYTGDDAYPPEDKIPDVNLEIMTNFGKPPDEGEPTN